MAPTGSARESWIRIPRFLAWCDSPPPDLAEAVRLASDLAANGICLPNTAEAKLLAAARAECSHWDIRFLVSLYPRSWSTCVRGNEREAFRAAIASIRAGCHPDGVVVSTWGALDACACSACREAFRAETRLDAPADVADPGDPALGPWLDAIDRRAAEWTAAALAAIREGTSACAAILPESADPAVRGDADALILPAAQRSGPGRLLMPRATGDDRPGILPVSYAVDEPRVGKSGVARPSADLEVDLRGCIAGGAFPMIVDPLLHDRRATRAVTAAFRFIREHAFALDPVAVEPDPAVTIVWQDDSDRPTETIRSDLVARALAPEAWSPGMAQEGIGLALLREHVPFRRVPRSSLERALDGATVVIIADVAVLTDDERKLLRRFVRAGGGLVHCGRTGVLDGDLRKVPGFGLADVLGVEIEDVTSASGGGVLRIDAVHEISAGLVWRSAIPVDGDVVAVTPATTGFVVARWRNMSSGREERPAIMAHRFGTGRAVRLAAGVAATYRQSGTPDLGRLVANCVRWASGDRVPALVDGPDTVHMTISRADRRLYVHLLNRRADLSRPVTDVASAADLPVWVRIPKDIAVRRARSAADDSDLVVTPTDEGAWCVITRLDLHDLIAFELEPAHPAQIHGREDR